MTIKWADNFEIYGDDVDAMLDGLYAQLGSDFGVGLVGTALVIPDFEEESRYWLEINGRGAGVRRVIGETLSEVGFCIGFYLPYLPSLNDRLYLLQLRDGSNTENYNVEISSTGNVRILNSAGTAIVATTNNPVTAGNFYIMQVQFTYGDPTGEVEVRLSGQGDGSNLTPIIGGASLVPATGLSLPGDVAQVFIGNNSTVTTGDYAMYVKFAVLYGLTGTYNSDWPRISGVATLQLTGDVTAEFFTPRPYEMFGAANLVIGADGTGDVLDCSAGAEFDLADDDFTLEGSFRFSNFPTTTAFATLMGKWSASTSKRSYRLVKYGPSTNGGALRFEITTDGTLGTLTPVIDVVYDFQIGTQYHIAVTRDAGVTRLFINGDQVGIDVADANVYYAAGISAKFTVGGEMSGVGSTVLANSSFKGHVDEIRITPGVARYTANFTPPATKFPRSVAEGDADFASVVLLAGFDEAIEDESDLLNTLTARGDVVRIEYNDAGSMTAAINEVGVTDDRFIEGPFIPASGVFTLLALPTAAETVTIGSFTYTFVSTLTTAFDVLIGATVTETLENLNNAVNLGPGIGVTYGASTTVNTDARTEFGPELDFQLTATAVTAGVAGNSLASTTTAADGSWTGATLAGGTDLPDPIEFTIEPLPIEATGLRALILIDRAFLNADAGTAQKSFVVDGNVAAGADNSLSETPSYRFDVIEEDPDTAAGLTPQSVLVGRLRYERTS